MKKENGEYHNLELGFQIGYAVKGTVGPAGSRYGQEIVADLSDYEVAVAQFWTQEAATQLSYKAGFSTHMGLVAGLDDIQDFFGPHYAAVATASSVLLAGVSTEPAIFTTWDYQEKGWGEDLGPFGFRFSIAWEFGMDTWSAASPIGGVNLAAKFDRGSRSKFVGGTQNIKSLLDGIDSYALDINPKLVTMEDEEPCPESWTEEDSNTNCKIKLTNEDESHLQRGAKLGISICAVSGGCINPFSIMAAAAATGVGAIRSTGQSVNEYCEFDMKE